MQNKKVTILGSTGTIGKNTIELIQDNKNYKIVALTAKTNVKLLAQQARILSAEVAVIEDETLYETLKEELSGTNIRAISGKKGIEEAASLETDILISGIVGSAALAPTLAAIKQGTNIGLANKECLVCAGDLMIEEVKKNNSFIIPVDSEHNSIFQCLQNNSFQHSSKESPSTKYIKTITLTASGGPFWNTDIKHFKNITPEQAVAHPNWDMGAKISVDSATMMNKGLELIEAFHLFDIEKDNLDVVIHPQSIIHGLVNYNDGSSLAGMSIPDMKVPISYALAWPGRIDTTVQTLDLAAVGNLTFEKPDPDKFPALKIAKQTLQEGGTAPAIFNAANEIAVDNFLKNNISFTQITDIVEKTLNNISTSLLTSIEQVYDIDQEARATASQIIKNI